MESTDDELEAVFFEAAKGKGGKGKFSLEEMKKVINGVTDSAEKPVQWKE